MEQRLTRSQKKLIPNISGPGADKIGNTITELFNAFDEEGKEIELKKEEELQKIKGTNEQVLTFANQMKTLEKILAI